jgi:hypothetical protein
MAAKELEETKEDLIVAEEPIAPLKQIALLK